ncbi:hypothetical protein LTR84_003732 [Exophiala bonariae]|uniref:Uncharacterized protein n=1 Tax=Exophiala bonariae TaxID=1690606 RepID=A0AAV9N9P3_9EURO|nr:hypothetical protein LTR84_003732 [Exophiala bonariae]
MGYLPGSEIPYIVPGSIKLQWRKELGYGAYDDFYDFEQDKSTAGSEEDGELVPSDDETVSSPRARLRARITELKEARKNRRARREPTPTLSIEEQIILESTSDVFDLFDRLQKTAAIQTLIKTGHNKQQFDEIISSLTHRDCQRLGADGEAWQKEVADAITEKVILALEAIQEDIDNLRDEKLLSGNLQAS